MILFFGGTTETGDICSRLLELNENVLVSTATNSRLRLPSSPRLTRRSGPLSAREIILLAQSLRVSRIVDATHPYATEIRKNTVIAAKQIGIPHAAYTRPAYFTADMPGVTICESHTEAARLACETGMSILMTIGSNHLAEYIASARHHNVQLHARVLSMREYLNRTQHNELPGTHLISGRGPYTLQENINMIQQRKIGVMVTKDGGRVAAVDAKYQACQSTNCKLLVIARPPVEAPISFGIIDDLVNHVRKAAQ